MILTQYMLKLIGAFKKGDLDSLQGMVTSRIHEVL